MRGQNQMRIITAIIQKATASKSKVLMNYSGILNALSGMFKTSVPSSDIEKMVKMQLNDMAEWKITSYAVTGKNGSETTYSSPNYKAYVMWPDDKAVAEGASKIRKVMEGKTLQ
jgi:anionic cell wall polymer biosynthesis LytR-Cps2A-Psr (LCP) family protein